jgi:hypothetical protein
MVRCQGQLRCQQCSGLLRPRPQVVRSRDRLRPRQRQLGFRIFRCLKCRVEALVRVVAR